MLQKIKYRNEHVAIVALVLQQDKGKEKKVCRAVTQHLKHSKYRCIPVIRLYNVRAEPSMRTDDCDALVYF